MINTFILLVAFFLFLFFLYYLARDDFVIIRKDIALDKIFTMAIISGIVTLIFARFFFVIFNFKQIYLNPLVFLAIPYYPGLSLIGGVVSGEVFVYMYALFKKMPVGRLTDLFTMAFIGVFPIAYMFHIFLLLGRESALENVIFVSAIVLLFVFTKLLFPFASKGEIRDGTLALIFVLILAFIYFTGKLFLDVKDFSFMMPENIFILVTFFVSLILIINQELINKYLTKK